MMILDTFGPAFGLPDASPFCIKTMCLLTLSGVPWQCRGGVDSRKAPYGKLPVLHDGELSMPDSDSIRYYLESVSGTDFDVSLNKGERHLAQALIRMVEEHLNFCLVYDRWVVEENWRALRVNFFADMPAVIRLIVPALVRRQVLRNLSGQGIGRLRVPCRS